MKQICANRTLLGSVFDLYLDHGGVSTPRARRRVAAASRQPGGPGGRARRLFVPGLAGGTALRDGLSIHPAAPLFRA